MAKEKKNGLNISVRSFITAIAVIFALMILSYMLTLVIQPAVLPMWKGGFLSGSGFYPLCWCWVHPETAP